jgi:hypothetical protein
MDSNHDKVIQSHLCYRYTTRQKRGTRGSFAYPKTGRCQLPSGFVTFVPGGAVNWNIDSGMASRRTLE